MYTINNSYLLGGFRIGTWSKLRAKYRILGGYGNINLAYYKEVNDQELKTNFNFKMVPLVGSLQPIIRGTKMSAGIKYMYIQTQVRLESETLPEYVTNKELDSRVSMPGAIVDYDSRDNIFTPDKGYYAFASLMWSNSIFASDYNYENLNVYGLAYYSLRKNLIAGFRLEMQQVFGATPFYLKPYINLRGIPAMRYQGNIFSLGETEFRWDFVPRWSVVAFAGTGKAYDEWSGFDDTSWRTSGGAGFRYLAARVFKLRMGLDIARGPEQWAYYIVFGSTWAR
jgi:outer membrane protein assembly factor BamA